MGGGEEVGTDFVLQSGQTTRVVDKVTVDIIYLQYSVTKEIQLEF
jgi:hypothetical protein